MFKMAWTSPMTFASNTILASSDLNIYLRDNLLEMSPAKAETPGSLLISDSPNSIQERTPTSDFISVTETTNSTSYTDLNTDGPTVTVECGTSVFVFMYTNLLYSTTSGGSSAWMSYAISGDTISAANDAWGINLSSTGGQRVGSAIMHSGLTPGSNTFTAKYRATSGTGQVATFSNRRLAVLPL
jgi:hypothetical protein